MQTAMIGDTLSLECKATGNPAPTIRWRHTRPNSKLPNDMDGEYSTGVYLNITTITVDDRGEYECIASNGDDETQQKATTFIRMNCK